MKLYKHYKSFIPREIEKLDKFFKQRPVHKALAKLNIKHAVKIFTFTSPDELTMLYWLAYSVPLGGKCLEIGSYLGASACYIAAGLVPREGHLYCVDTWNNETMPDGQRDTYQEFLNNIAPLQKYITPIRKNSLDLDKSDIPDPIDLVFIDGDHEYSSIKNDFQKASQFLERKAVVAFHDCLAFPGVSRVIGEVLAMEGWVIGGLVGNLFWIRKT